MKTYRKKEKVFKWLLFAMLCCVVTFLLPAQTEAKNKKSTKETKSIEAVLDYADMLTKEEEKELKKAEKRFEEETGMHCFIIITKDRREYTHNKSSDDYEDSVAYNNAFYDTLVTEYGKEYKDSSVLLLTLPENRYALVSGYGQLQYDLEGECDWIFQNIKGDLSNGNYANACKDYINYVKDFCLEEDTLSEETMVLDDSYEYEAYPSNEYDTYPSNSVSENEEMEENVEKVMTLGGPFLIALGMSFVIIMILLWCAGGIKTTTSTTYLDRNHSRVVGKYDNYIRTKTRRTRIEDSSSHHHSHSGGGGGSSSRSSGGGTHGGGSF